MLRSLGDLSFPAHWKEVRCLVPSDHIYYSKKKKKRKRKILMYLASETGRMVFKIIEMGLNYRNKRFGKKFKSRLFCLA